MTLSAQRCSDRGWRSKVSNASPRMQRWTSGNAAIQRADILQRFCETRRCIDVTVKKESEFIMSAIIAPQVCRWPRKEFLYQIGFRKFTWKHWILLKSMCDLVVQLWLSPHSVLVVQTLTGVDDRRPNLLNNRLSVQDNLQSLLGVVVRLHAWDRAPFGKSRSSHT